MTKTLYYFKESTRTWESYSDLSFINFSGGTVTINYSVASFTGAQSSPYPILTYLMKYTIEDPRSVQSDNFIEDQFEITIRYDCSLDTVTKSGSNIGSQLLIIDETDVTVTLQFTQSHSSASCPLAYALEFYNDNTLEWYTYSSEAFVHTQSNSSPSVRLKVANG